MAAFPSTGNYNVGDTFTVTVNVNASQSFNAASANLATSSNLVIQSVAPGSCNLSSIVVPTTSAPNFAGAIMGGSSTACTAYTLTLKAMAPGPATVSIAGGQVMAYTDSTDILSTVSGGLYCIGSAGCAPTHINSVQLSGSGQALQITVNGSGFGNAPVPMPYSGDLAGFQFTDLTRGWNAGNTTDLVLLNYTSWTDSQIVINGFAGPLSTYGIAPGDSVEISMGPTLATTWTGTLPNDGASLQFQGTPDGTPTNTVTLTTGKQSGYVVTICNSGGTTWTAPTYAPQWSFNGINKLSGPTLRAGSVPDPNNIAPNQCPTWDMSFGPASTNSGLTGTMQMANNGSGFGVTVTFEVDTTIALPPPTTGAYHALSPLRIYDTRFNGLSALGAGEARCIPVAGLGGVAANATAVALNVAVTDTTSASFLTVYPSGGNRPYASSLNWTAGETVPNLVVVKLGPDGQICFYSPYGSLDVVVDLQGWFGPATTPGAGSFTPLPPQRILDTRFAGNGTALGPGEARNVQVTGQGGVPSTGVAAVVLNVAVTNPTTGSYLTVYPAGVTPPTASNLNFTAGETVPNRVIVPVGAGGQVSLYNALGSVDAVVDVNGWFGDGSAGSGGSTFTGLTPARIFDSRGAPDGPAVGPGEVRSMQVAGRGGVPVGATAVVVNVAVTDPTASSFLTVYPSDVTRPNASDLNWTAGETVPNLVVVKLGADGKVDAYSPYGQTDVVVDVVGYFGSSGSATPAGRH